MPYFLVISIFFFKKSKYFILFSKLYYYVCVFRSRNHVTFYVIDQRIILFVSDVSPMLSICHSLKILVILILTGHPNHAPIMHLLWLGEPRVPTGAALFSSQPE